MDNELDDVARSLFNGQIPPSWRKLAPATLKNLGGWMDHFTRRNQQYLNWVCFIYRRCIITYDKMFKQDSLKYD